MYNSTPASATSRRHHGTSGLREYRESFFLHLRPRKYDSIRVNIQRTWLLGFFSVFFLAVEWFTGAVLMIYYAPTPAEAYESIVRLETVVPFGSLIRDLHRLGGECMIIAVTLHMLRVLLAGSYHGARGFTWLTGMLLLLCTLILAFSGYLLPWDQLAYWAVTIGTSITDTIPILGQPLALIIRGGENFGQDGLLRFYLLHIVAFPALMIMLLAIHYYRVARLHMATTASSATSAGEKPAQPSTHEQGKMAFFPAIPLFELCLSLLALTALLAAVTFCYDAPLQHHADPRHTPADTRAPWFFLWLQGALKYGDSLVMGICFPLALFLLLTALPYIPWPRSQRQSNRSLSKTVILSSATMLLILSALGLPRYGVDINPVSRIFKTFAPEEGRSRFHEAGFADLPQAIFTTDRQPSPDLPESLRKLLADFTRDVAALTEAEGYLDPGGIILIEDWQDNLKRITLRIHWQDQSDNSAPTQPMSAETSLYVHRGEKVPSPIDENTP